MWFAEGDKDSAEGDRRLASWEKSLADYTDYAEAIRRKYAEAIRRKVVGVSIRMASA